MNYLIVTNNPLVKEKINEISLKYCQSLEQVMLISRDLIHQGYKLVTHPLAGSVKPAQNPYRSVLLLVNKELDYRSLEIIEMAIYKLKQFQKTKGKVNYPTEILQDYQLIDYSLISSGMMSSQLR